ncbi:hypothetical protein KSS87_014028 [Heliosperma pusillum]|nr:hypothetical protein KSS87_014028 [Heliosperma pusillum]
MAEDFCSYDKETFAVKLPKTSPLILKLIVLVIATVFGVYICSVCLRQLTSQTKSMIEVFERPNCVTDRVNGSYLHFPQPMTFSRAECAGNPVRFFVIISMQRSGSGWFETLLNSHTNVSSNGEIFSIKDRRDNISSIIKTLDKVYNLDWLTSASKNECSAAVGFKWMLNQAETLSSYKPIINSTLLLPTLKEAELTITQSLTYYNTTRHIVFFYEDLVKNDTARRDGKCGLRRREPGIGPAWEEGLTGHKLVDALDFMGVPRTRLSSRQVKIHKGPLWDHIKNWDEVKRALNGTPYESFLQPDY